MNGVCDEGALAFQKEFTLTLFALTFPSDVEVDENELWHSIDINLDSALWRAKALSRPSIPGLVPATIAPSPTAMTTALAGVDASDIPPVDVNDIPGDGGGTNNEPLEDDSDVFQNTVITSSAAFGPLSTLEDVLRSTHSTSASVVQQTGLSSYISAPASQPQLSGTTSVVPIVSNHPSTTSTANAEEPTNDSNAAPASLNNHSHSRSGGSDSLLGTTGGTSNGRSSDNEGRENTNISPTQAHFIQQIFAPPPDFTADDHRSSTWPPTFPNQGESEASEVKGADSPSIGTHRFASLDPETFGDPREVAATQIGSTLSANTSANLAGLQVLPNSPVAGIKVSPVDSTRSISPRDVMGLPDVNDPDTRRDDSGVEAKSGLDKVASDTPTTSARLQGLKPTAEANEGTESSDSDESSGNSSSDEAEGNAESELKGATHGSASLASEKPGSKSASVSGTRNTAAGMTDVNFGFRDRKADFFCTLGTTPLPATHSVTSRTQSKLPGSRSSARIATAGKQETTTPHPPTTSQKKSSQGRKAQQLKTSKSNVVTPAVRGNTRSKATRGRPAPHKGSATKLAETMGDVTRHETTPGTVLKRQADDGKFHSLLMSKMLT